MIAAVFEILTVGFPFCAFKLIAGFSLAQHWLTAWGIADTLINATNLLWLLTVRRRATEVCLLSLLMRLGRRGAAEQLSHWRDLGAAGDMFFSFVIVAFMLGGGFLTSLPAWHLKVWNLSVILNVLGAGSMRLRDSITSLRASR